MKKLITQVFALALGLAGSFGALAQQPPLELAKDAPDRYVVVKGDTLWDISGKFLQKPWRWPEIWDLNRDQIANPHLIYPGDVIWLDVRDGKPRLRLGRAVGGSGGADAGAIGGGGGEPARRLSPMVRADALEKSPIPTVNYQAIEPFLNRPLVVDEKGLQSNPRVVAAQESRFYLGAGDLVYVRGLDDPSVGEWHLYRQAKPLLDPDTRKPIAWEALFVGTARLERPGDPATLRITATTEEIGVGDRLIPAQRRTVPTFVPHAPDGKVDGRIVSVYRGVTQVGRNSVVAINRGSADGLELGHVLSILQRGGVTKDRENRQKVTLPDEPVGQLLIFRVFDNIAYGLVVEAHRSIAVGDVVSNP